MILNKRQKYLQVAMNRGLNEAVMMAMRLPRSERVIVEAGTPLIKKYGMEAVRRLADVWPYVVADLKTMDRGGTEVKMAKEAGASAAVALGQAPVETIDSFIENCRKESIDSMVDMMNVDQPLKTLRKLKKMPEVVILHRGVDEEEFNHDKPIPYIQINKIRSAYGVMIAIAGGDTIWEVQRAVFNDADIVVIWKQPEMAEEFLEEVK